MGRNLSIACRKRSQLKELNSKKHSKNIDSVTDTVTSSSIFLLSRIDRNLRLLDHFLVVGLVFARYCQKLLGDVIRGLNQRNEKVRRLGRIKSQRRTCTENNRQQAPNPHSLSQVLFRLRSRKCDPRALGLLQLLFQRFPETSSRRFRFARTSLFQNKRYSSRPSRNVMQQAWM